MNIRQFSIAIATLCAVTACNNPITTNNSASAPQASATSATTLSQSTAASQPASVFSGTDVRKDNLGGEFTLTDGDGKPFSISSLKGKAVILAFGFTNCPDVCPTELVTYNDVMTQLGEQSKEVAVVFISVDPERDTPELMGKYVKQFNPNFIGLTATGDQQIALVKQQYRVVSAKTEIKSDTVYSVDHTAGTFLLDKKGDVVAFERYGATAEQIANDLRVVLKSL